MSLHVPAHAQQTDGSERPDLVKRAADLCRARPAVFARVVRVSDHLERHGWDRHAALERALDEAGA